MTASPDPWVALLAGFIVCLGAAVTIALVSKPLLRSLRSWSPEVRAVACFLLLIAPVAAGASAAVTTGLLADGFMIDLVTHHCHANVTWCDAHGPLAPNPALSALGAGLLAGGLLWLAMTAAARVRMTVRTTNLLNLAARNVGNSDVGILGTDDTVACVIGILRPRVFLSRGLWRRLSVGERKIVLRHERAHLSRRDYPVRQLATMLALGHARGTVKRLLDELILAQEQACDRAAARFYGTLRTAETLLKVARFRRKRLQVAGAFAGFLDASVAARVHALLDPAFLPATRCVASLCCVIVVAAAALLGSTELLHHTAETIVQSIVI